MKMLNAFFWKQNFKNVKKLFTTMVWFDESKEDAKKANGRKERRGEKKVWWDERRTMKGKRKKKKASQKPVNLALEPAFKQQRITRRSRVSLKIDPLHLIINVVCGLRLLRACVIPVTETSSLILISHDTWLSRQLTVQRNSRFFCDTCQCTTAPEHL